MATTTADKKTFREKAYEDIEIMLINEWERSRENWHLWNDKSPKHSDRLKMKAYWIKKERLLDSLLNKLSKLSKG